MAALGDAKATNRQYRKVLLTSGEARLLREGNWEARTMCARGIGRRLVFGLPVAALVASALLLWAGQDGLARTLLVGGLGIGMMLMARFLPVYTVSRGRVVRVVKWVVLATILGVAFSGDVLKNSWLLFACVWPIALTEWTRASIRRKLPVTRWPKHLYF